MCVSSISAVLIFKLKFVFFSLCVCARKKYFVIFFLRGVHQSINACIFPVRFHCSSSLWLLETRKRRRKHIFITRIFISRHTKSAQSKKKKTNTSNNNKQNETGKQITYLWTHSDICVLPWLRLLLFVCIVIIFS